MFEDNNIYIDFTNDPDKAAVFVNTCSRILTISTLIKPIILLKDELQTLVNSFKKSDSRFTMP